MLRFGLPLGGRMEVKMKKILVLGGTGAMGTYLVPKLAERGYSVDVVSIDDMQNKELIGLCVIPVETETYLNCFDNYWGARYQLIYDRFFNRIVDNSKILRVTGMKQSELMPLYKGLEKELSTLPKDYDFGSFYVNDNMDKILKTL